MPARAETKQLSPSRQEREVRKSLKGRSNLTKERIVGKFDLLRSFGFSHQDLLENVTDIASSYGPGRAERYIEGISGIWETNQENFDFEEFNRLFRMAHIRFGAGVAAHFTRSLKHIVSISQSPQEYFDLVDKAVEVGGKKFARYYASSLPWVWGRGGNPVEYRSTAISVLRNTDFRTASSFLWCAPHVLEIAKLKPEQFSEICIEMHKRLGSYVSYWAIRGFSGSFVYGMSPDEFISQVKEVSVTRGQEAAGWFASGFQGIANLGKDRLEDFARCEKEIAELDPKKYIWGSSYEERLASKERLRQNAQDDINGIRSIDYKNEYLEILDLLGQPAASFYVRILNLALIQRGSITNYRMVRDEVRDIKALPQEIKETARVLRGPDFRVVVWFGFKIPCSVKDAIQYLHDSRVISEVFGGKHIRPQLRYTLFARSKSRALEDGIIFPWARPDTNWTTGYLVEGREDDEEGLKQLLESK